MLAITLKFSLISNSDIVMPEKFCPCSFKARRSTVFRESPMVCIAYFDIGFEVYILPITASLCKPSLEV